LVLFTIVVVCVMAAVQVMEAGIGVGPQSTLEVLKVLAGMLPLAIF
jgi:hypothetical protein